MDLLALPHKSRVPSGGLVDEGVHVKVGEVHFGHRNCYIEFAVEDRASLPSCLYFSVRKGIRLMRYHYGSVAVSSALDIDRVSRAAMQARYSLLPTSDLVFE